MCSAPGKAHEEREISAGVPDVCSGLAAGMVSFVGADRLVERPRVVVCDEKVVWPLDNEENIEVTGLPGPSEDAGTLESLADKEESFDRCED